MESNEIIEVLLSSFTILRLLVIIPFVFAKKLAVFLNE